MRHKKSILWIILSKLFGLLLFLCILFAMNFLIDYINNPFFSSTVAFINENALFLIVMSLVFMLGSIFNELFFPFNLPAPIINAIASIFMILFLKRIFLFLDSLINMNVSIVFNIFSYALYPIVFLFVLIGGYISIFTRLFVAKPAKEEKKEKVINVKRIKTFEEVGKEFGQAFSDLFEAIKNSFKKK